MFGSGLLRPLDPRLSLGWRALKTPTSEIPDLEVMWPRSRFNTSGPNSLRFDWEDLAASRGTVGDHRRSSYRSWGGVCSGHRTGTDMAKTVSGGLKWGCGITDNTLAKLVSALPFCIPPSTQLSLMATKLNLLVSMVRHLTTKTWDQCNKQICGSSSRGSILIYHFMSIRVAISFHCLLTLLATLQWIATMHIKSGLSAPTADDWQSFAASKIEVES